MVTVEEARSLKSMNRKDIMTDVSNSIYHAASKGWTGYTYRFYTGMLPEDRQYIIVELEKLGFIILETADMAGIEIRWGGNNNE